MESGPCLLQKATRKERLVYNAQGDQAVLQSTDSITQYMRIFPYAGIHTPKWHENYDSDFFNHHKHPMRLANDFRRLFLGLEKWFSS